MDADQEERKADRIVHRELMRQMMAKICAETDAIKAEMKAIHERRMAKLDAHQEGIMAHQEATETEPNP
jgi:hypothetical protein